MPVGYCSVCGDSLRRSEGPLSGSPSTLGFNVVHDSEMACPSQDEVTVVGDAECSNRGCRNIAEFTVDGMRFCDFCAEDALHAGYTLEPCDHSSATPHVFAGNACLADGKTGALDRCDLCDLWLYPGTAIALDQDTCDRLGLR